MPRGEKKYDYVDPEFDAILDRIIHAKPPEPKKDIDSMTIEELRDYAKSLEKQLSEKNDKNDFRRR